MKKKSKKLPPHIVKLYRKLSALFDVRAYQWYCNFPNKDEDNVALQIDVDEQYQRLTIKYFPTFFTHTRDEQRAFLLHEFCHIITHPLVDLLYSFKAGHLVTPQQVKAESERATSRVANIIHGLLTDEYSNSKKAYRVYLQLPKRSKTKLAKSKGK